MKSLKKVFSADILFGTFILGICVWFFIMGTQLETAAVAGRMDAGFFPRMLAVIIGCMAAALIVISAVHPKNYFAVNSDRENLKKFWGTVLMFGVYVMLWKYVHFIIITEIFLLGMCWLLKIGKKFAVIYSTILSVGLFYLFASVFKIILN
ncbi:tripartite tricarboxylate transporter TctB family protein [Caproiciproducens sp. NJN-50]|uniref:tripartite tricarboxylate transporter TctB family protein n=1 Tax=Acutalibacteraceae TaxID=3082771 RepID=UPI000FFE2DD1|nr:MULTISPECIES: tripartite tricarboxylate transporter TctB family protein [Acutalibacteraceae]QAT49135.1 tripartite tricarboxylate transporter TctB family protein [Caproiciproducens sp. NJN-50]